MKTYVCAHCKGEFPYEDGWGDEEAAAESEATFGFLPPPEQQAVICDVCWKAFLPWAEAEGLTVNPN